MTLPADLAEAKSRSEPDVIDPSDFFSKGKDLSK